MGSRQTNHHDAGRNREQLDVTPTTTSAAHHTDDTSQRETNQHLEHLLTLAGHELRTPLTAINGNIQLAQRRLSSGDPSSGHTMETVLELLTRTKRQLDRMNNLIEQILHAERIHEGQLDLQRARYDLVSIARETTEQYRLLWPHRTITLAPPAIEQGDIALYVVADVEHIAQVIANYLSNALKFSPDDTPIVLRVERLGNQAHLAVRDQGPGLPPEEHERIWERFYRVPGTRELSGSGIGFGLGLYICREVITQHGGQVGVNSAPGKGSTFWYRLDLAPDVARAE
ncbi:MAG: sensor histidine kinase [Ktedonobacterales bacterium]